MQVKVACMFSLARITGKRGQAMEEQLLRNWASKSSSVYSILLSVFTHQGHMRASKK